LLGEKFSGKGFCIIPFSIKLNNGTLNNLSRCLQPKKKFKGCCVLIITDEIRVVIAAEACMPVPALPYNLYNSLFSVLIYPSTVVIPPSTIGVFTESPLVEKPETPVYGQAFSRGPVILVRDEAKREARHPEPGHNVVYHEFSHLLAMDSGAANS